jgi:alkylation response protein AidB-like acyl-CoA dehydrogenase
MHESPLDTPGFAELLTALRAANAELERSGSWPGAAWRLLDEAGVLRWFLPEEYGGDPVDEVTRQRGYLELASACLTTTFILTQRNGAVSRILLSENEPLKRDLSQQIAGNDIFATVGISHLTTSRQHLATPVVEARPDGDGWVLTGEIPWVTGAEAADVIVTGGVQPDGLQVLVALDTSSDGVTVQPPPRLLALNEARTASVTLDEVRVSRERRLLGPEPQVLKAGGAGGVTTSALGIGAAQKSILGIEAEAEKRDDLRPVAAHFRETLDALKTDLAALTQSDEAPSKDALEALRKQSNSLALRSAQAYLTACKGAGFLADHPASRAIREAQFFLVWSCPQPVMAAALAEFACPTSR